MARSLKLFIKIVQAVSLGKSTLHDSAHGLKVDGLIDPRRRHGERAVGLGEVVIAVKRGRGKHGGEERGGHGASKAAVVSNGR